MPKVRELEMDEEFILCKNSICRGCFSLRMEVQRFVQDVRDRGGLEACSPPEEVRKRFEQESAHLPRPGRGARIQGLTSEQGAQLNGKFCKLSERAETGRWMVQLLGGESKSIKEESLECSLEIDKEYQEAHFEWFKENKDTALADMMAQRAGQRPLGKHTSWPKVRGIHPGAVVRLQGLTSSALNGRKGRCISYDPTAERWKVDLGDEFKSIKPMNLVPATGEKPPTRQSAEAEKRQFGIVDEDQHRSPDKQKTEQEKFAASYGWTG